MAHACFQIKYAIRGAEQTACAQNNCINIAIKRLFTSCAFHHPAHGLNYCVVRSNDNRNVYHTITTGVYEDKLQSKYNRSDSLSVVLQEVLLIGEDIKEITHKPFFPPVTYMTHTDSHIENGTHTKQK